MQKKYGIMGSIIIIYIIFQMCSCTSKQLQNIRSTVDEAKKIWKEIPFEIREKTKYQAPIP